MEFRIWLLSLGVIILRFMHIVAQIHSSFLFLSCLPLHVYTTICLSIHLLMGLLGSFQFAAITNKAAGNVHVQVFAWTCTFFSLQ